MTLLHQADSDLTLAIQEMNPGTHHQLMPVADGVN